MVRLRKTLEIGSSPHITDGASVDVIMLNVFLALLPVSVFAIYAFGNGAALVLLTATLACVLTEHVLCRATGQPSTVGDWSVAITGLIYGLTLPPDLPLWMVAVGSSRPSPAIRNCCMGSRPGPWERPAGC
jgi:electron transport complex protein RnfD